MPDVIKINSSKGLVKFSKEELIEKDLLKWVRSSSKGIGNIGLLADHPFETAAAKVFVEKFPSDQVKIAEKCQLQKDSSVEITLRIATRDSYYNTHPTKLVYRKQEQKSADS